MSNSRNNKTPKNNSTLFVPIIPSVQNEPSQSATQKRIELFYRQAHQLASKNPNEICVIKVDGDDKDMIEVLDFFRQNPKLLPANVEIHPYPTQSRSSYKL